MSAGVTSVPSQLERPCAWAGLSSSGAEVAVILDEAIMVAGTGHESRSPMLLVLAEAEQRGEVNLSGIPISHKLVGKEDLLPQINQR
jgi:hypothetical protein